MSQLSPVQPARRAPGKAAAAALVATMIVLCAPVAAGAASWTDSLAPKASWTDSSRPKASWTDLRRDASWTDRVASGTRSAAATRAAHARS